MNFEEEEFKDPEEADFNAASITEEDDAFVDDVDIPPLVDDDMLDDEDEDEDELLGDNL
jgi:hypothetical protein